MKTWKVLWASLFLCSALGAQAELFPFSMKGGEAGGEADLSGELLRPAGKRGFPAARGGHLVLGERRVRFWGTNLCFDACFPEPEEAKALADRLAAFGMGCVRLHHMDARSIWGKSKDHLHIDPQMQARLDGLVAALEARGIHLDVNLHVSRWFGPKEGFGGDRRLRPKYDKGLDNFEPRMIALQKKYARDLLAHVNPFTGKSLAADPAVAFVEISNEDSLFSQWWRGILDTLPEPYASTFRKLWNKWLRRKYGSTEKTRRAWGSRGIAAGPELLEDRDLQAGPRGPWRVERDERTRFSVETRRRGGPGGGPYFRLKVSRVGQVAWRPQVHQAGFALEGGAWYTLSFQARADPPRSIRVNCMMGHEPWRNLGLDARVRLGRAWKKVTRVFKASRGDPHARVTFTGLSKGILDLARVSLKKGAPPYPGKGERIEEDSLPVPRKGNLPPSATALSDFLDFLWDTEKSYWLGMGDFLEKDLGVRALVSGTQLGYSPVHVQARLDYLDTHAYWHHPRFPGRPWDRRNWWVREEALVNRPVEFLGGIAARRVLGKPFTLSEYNHPQPSRYGAEGFPVIAAFGAFQDWDGIFVFTWSHDRDYTPGRITGYFDVKGDPARLVHMAACAHLFARGDVRPGRRILAVPFGKEREKKALLGALAGGGPRSVFSLVPPGAGLLERIGLDLEGKGSGSHPGVEIPKRVERWVSDTGELCWDLSRAGAGFFTADTPRTKVFTGFPAGRRIRLGGVELSFGKTRLGWATATLTCLDGEGFDRPGRILVAATGLEENRGAGREDLGRGRITLRDRWGKAPVLCEGIPLVLALPYPASKVRLFALDQRGRRKEEISPGSRAGKALLRLGPSHGTLWYLAVLAP